MGRLLRNFLRRLLVLGPRGPGGLILIGLFLLGFGLDHTGLLLGAGTGLRLGAGTGGRDVSVISAMSNGGTGIGWPPLMRMTLFGYHFLFLGQGHAIFSVYFFHLFFRNRAMSAILCRFWCSLPPYVRLDAYVHKGEIWVKLTGSFV